MIMATSLHFPLTYCDNAQIDQVREELEQQMVVTRVIMHAQY